MANRQPKPPTHAVLYRAVAGGVGSNASPNLLLRQGSYRACLRFAHALCAKLGTTYAVASTTGPTLVSVVPLATALAIVPTQCSAPPTT